MTIDKLIIENEQEIEAIKRVIEQTKAHMEYCKHSYRFMVLDLMDIMLYQERLDTLTYQLRNLKAIKESGEQ